MPSKAHSVTGSVIVILTFALGSKMAKGVPSELQAERYDATRIIITWVDSAPVDIYVGPSADAAFRDAKPVTVGNRDGRYLATVAADGRPYFLLRDRIDGRIVRVSERLQPLEQGSNFRDLGGYAAAGGKHVRWGLIYRSGATPLLTDRDIRYLSSLRLSAMIDLRSVQERELAPTRLTGAGIRYLALDYEFDEMPQSYMEALTRLAPQFRIIFTELLSHKGPILYNCTAGQDRTGIATALILAALEVPRATILRDYDLSTTYRHPEYEMPAVDPSAGINNSLAQFAAETRSTKPPPLYTETGRSMLAEMLDETDRRWGSVDKYLAKELAVDASELVQLRHYYLE